MKDFATLLEDLLYAPQRNSKLRHLGRWLETAAAEDRGWGVAALAGELEFRHAKAGLVRRLAASASDEVLFGLSYDFVGDLAETTALIWPQQAEAANRIHSNSPTSLAKIITALQEANAENAETLLRGWLDQLDVSARWGLLKLVTGGMRIGVSGRMLRLAIARHYDRTTEEIEEIWPLLEPPYEALFDWLDGHAEKPSAEGLAVFRPLMLAHPLDDAAMENLDARHWMAEWKWDGARVQLAAGRDGVRLFSRSGDDISAAFPEVVTWPGWQQHNWCGNLDGELLAGTPDRLEPFQHLQQRLNRRRAAAALIRKRPVFLRLYDLLLCDGEDLREQPLEQRRQQLQRCLEQLDCPFMEMSEEIPFSNTEELAALRARCRDGGLIEGLMLKARGSHYRQGRIKGLWFKWKRDPLRADVVLLYAQRGHGKRSSFYSDYTFGAWMEDAAGRRLVPVGKAYSGFTDDELKKLDRFVRENTVNRFGPVRELAPLMVVEVAFDSLASSSRHKSGIAMRFPRIARLRWDKPASEADTLETLKLFLPDTREDETKDDS